MSDDEDYMSDKFLLSSEKDVPPPSLIRKHSDRREHALMKRKAEIELRMKEKNKPMRVVEAEKREEGLSSAITSTNKGFEMLMKMGYKPGKGIGKTQSGMVEPISVEVKADRQGLGKMLKKKESYSRKNTDATLDNMKVTDFRSRIAQERTEQLQKIDLYKSQKVCQELDAKETIEEPEESWFWPQVKEEKTDDDVDDDPQSNDADANDEALADLEKLKILTKYLRKKHFYCIWCGTQFDGEEDLRDNCPGSTRSDH
ncbi:G patch domain-containing protein 11 [Harpegnathos saltator]|uniref:G patch domain-containing protein 11 n=1 Tax=Harpegnathos saltator TaxID=610380 RepID=E2BTT3_HARSA|nr:G patch domain-containing protein 11 [Harpegnathos saltator]XP_011144960.1 G patch domain-containing protein 11 [Harpegnathos saltator]XP_011144962.1 G patch domain-containing protein 11 [Harpegnathos saltator]XP_011144963.1 G patch domain-containing protein 11 [Harpegnathos saltator]XP_011144964.1 G patch domain-containing protein 11 [Harpegnathos saltator]XP_025153850.1 G patch domain-containing protein 11 [Harpegnathos saltator]EFN80832.1 Coiled-coil domain-containing protein 75 [Harpeg